MPIQVIQYQCNECFNVYLNEQAAVNCEFSHHKLDDFEISKIGKHSYNSYFPDSIFVVNKKTDKIASYVFNNDNAKPKSVKQTFLDHLDKTYKRQLKNHYNTMPFSVEEEDG